MAVHLEQDLAEGQRLIEYAIRDLRSLGDSGVNGGIALGLGNLGAIHLRRGDLHSAHLAFDEALTLYNGFTPRKLAEEGALNMYLSQLAILEGDFAGALEFARVARTKALEVLGREHIELPAYSTPLVHALLLNGQWREAEQLMDEFEELHGAFEAANPRRQEKFRFFRAYITAGRGETERSLRAIEKLRADLADANGAEPMLVASVNRLAGQLHAVSGNRELASNRLTLAYEYYSGLSDHELGIMRVIEEEISGN